MHISATYVAALSVNQTVCSQPSPAMSSDAKRQKTTLRGFGGISDSKLCELLQRVKNNPSLLSEAAPSRFAMQRHDDRVIESEVRHNVTLRLNGGGEFVWQCASPLKTLRYFCENSESFRSLFDSVARDLPGDHIYRFIVYYDEITPGNLLRLDNPRKFWGVYGSCVELGYALQHSDVWLPLGVLRTSQAKRVEGGLAAVLAGVLSMFSGQVTLDLPVTGPRIVRLAVANNLGDEAALKRGLDIKGSAGAVPCLKCRNVLYTRAPTTPSSYIVTLACPTPSRFDPRTDDDVWTMCDQLAAKAASGTKKALADEEKVCGINYNVRSVLFSDRHLLRPVSTLTYDCMHVYFSNGVAGEELYLLMELLESVKVTWPAVAAWLKSGFAYPFLHKDKMLALHRCFGSARRQATRSSKEFKAQASDVLSLIPMMQHFLEQVVAPTPAARKIALGMESFARLAEVVAMLQLVNKDGAPTRFVPELRQRISAHFVAFTRAYPDTGARWKRHATFHIPDQILRDGRLLDSFALERKHQAPKAAAASVENFRVFERTVLVRTVQAQLHRLQEAPDLAFCNRVLGKHMVENGACIGEAVYWRGATLHRGDLLLWEEPFSGGIMEYAAMQGDQCVLLVRPLQLLDRDRFSSTWAKVSHGTPRNPATHTVCFPGPRTFNKKRPPPMFESFQK